MSEIKLLPCPFCGNEVRLCFYDDDSGALCIINYEDELDVGCSFVHCYNCDMDFMPNTDIGRGVLEAWNTRKTMERILERLGEASYDSMHLDTHIPMTDSWQIIDLDKALEIVKEEGGLNEV